MAQSLPRPIETQPALATLTASEQRTPSEADLPDSYETWREGYIAQRLQVLYVVGLVVNPIFIGLDYLAYRDHLASLLFLRAILEL
ncbi:MAG TPA: hypothetical protein VGA17_08880, partial [Nitrospiraceae bacterium]